MAVNEVQEVKLTTVRDEEQQVCLLHIHTQSTNHKLLIGSRASPIFYNVGLDILQCRSNFFSILNKRQTIWHSTDPLLLLEETEFPQKLQKSRKFV